MYLDTNSRCKFKKLMKYPCMMIKNFYYNFYFLAMIQYETFKTTSVKSFDRQIWSSYEIGHVSVNDLNDKYPNEYNELKDYSDYLIKQTLNNIETQFNQIYRTANGYTIYRSNSESKCIIRMNFNNNLIEIKRSI